MRERDIERHLVKRVKELGGECRKVQWIGRRGAPDRLVMLPAPVAFWASEVRDAGAVLDASHWSDPLAERLKGLACAIWVELKAPGIKPEAHQLREHERMRKMGQHVVVIDSIEGVEELLR